LSGSSHSSPPASAWTRAPPKAVLKKKKKLVAGRELRDRGVRKIYAESSSSEYEEEEEDEEQDIEQAEEDNHFTPEEEDEKPRTRKIILRISTELLQRASQSLEVPETNGATEKVEEDEQAVVEEEVEDLQAEVEELKETVIINEEEDEDDEGGPRRLTRRVTRQLLVKSAEVPERPSHGRKGVARQDKVNRRTSPDTGRRSSMRHRLRQEARRPSYSEKEKKKKKRKESESEFEDEGEEAIEDDDISVESKGNTVVDDDTEEGYSSAPRRKRTQKPPARKTRRSRNASDEESLEEDNDDLLEELREIGAEIPQRQRQLRPTERMNYFIPPPPDKDDIFLPPATPGRRRNGAGKGGAFGGFGGDFSGMGLGDRFRGITGLGTAGGADDSSDSDEEGKQRRPSGAMGALMPSGGGISGLSGTPANLGKYTPKSSMSLKISSLTIELADADPLGVDQNIDFSAVGGLDECIALICLTDPRYKSAQGNGHLAATIS
jgi:ATPase family AAA domain-containing protein 2